MELVIGFRFLDDGTLVTEFLRVDGWSLTRSGLCSTAVPAWTGAGPAWLTGVNAMRPLAPMIRQARAYGFSGSVNRMIVLRLAGFFMRMYARRGFSLIVNWSMLITPQAGQGSLTDFVEPSEGGAPISCLVD